MFTNGESQLLVQSHRKKVSKNWIALACELASSIQFEKLNLKRLARLLARWWWKYT